jgi:hypothetical protein
MIWLNIYTNICFDYVIAIKLRRAATLIFGQNVGVGFEYVARWWISDSSRNKASRRIQVLTFALELVGI